MASHADHAEAANHSPAQILSDADCPACADLSGDILAAVEQIDDNTFARAWDRAERKAAGTLPDVSEAECALLDVLWAVRFKLSMIGALRPMEVAA